MASGNVYILNNPSAPVSNSVEREREYYCRVIADG